MNNYIKNMTIPAIKNRGPHALVYSSMLLIVYYTTFYTPLSYTSLPTSPYTSGSTSATHSLPSNPLLSHTLSANALLILDQSPITLKIHSFFDGTFIDAARIEQIERFKHTLMQLLLGKKQPDGSFKGCFIFNDAYHSIESLKIIEATITSIVEREALKKLLEKIKNDFIKISNHYKNSTPGVKVFTTGFIKESCEKRNRLDSSLLTWAKTTPENEDNIFKQEITSFGKFYTFLIDLHNFFNDLTHSCPKAHALFIQEQKKIFAIKKLLPIVIQLIKNNNMTKNSEDLVFFDQKSFFNNIKKSNILSIIALENITTETVLKLYLEFLNSESNSQNT